MTKQKHELDELLIHYGVKGMQWGVRRSPEEIKSDIENGIGAAGEALEDAGDEVMGNDSITEELVDVIDVLFGGKGNLEKETAQLKDAIKDKLEDVSAEVKERGARMAKLWSIKSETKRTINTTITSPSGD